MSGVIGKVLAQIKRQQGGGAPVATPGKTDGIKTGRNIFEGPLKQQGILIDEEETVLGGPTKLTLQTLLGG